MIQRPIFMTAHRVRDTSTGFCGVYGDSDACADWTFESDICGNWAEREN